jgi:hypothetical protein
MSNPLAVRVQGTGSFDLVRFRQGLVAEVIETVPGALNGIISDHKPARAQQIGNRLFWIADNKMWQKTGAGAATQVLGPLASNTTFSGWLQYYMHPTNGPGLFGTNRQAAGTMHLYDYLTDTWSQVGLGVNTGNGGLGILSIIVINNVAHFTNSSFMYTIDPVALTAGATPSLAAAAALCPYNGLIYALISGTVNGGVYRIGNILGGVFVSLANVTNSYTTVTGSDNYYTRPAIYQIGGDTYVACAAAPGNDGFVAGKWDGAVYTDLSATLLPAALQAGGSLAASNADRWRMHTWKVNDNGTIRTFIHVALAYNATASLLYEHVGATWVLRNGSDWGNHYCNISNHTAGGELYYDESELNAVRIAKEVAVANGMSLQYFVNGDEGTTDTFCALWYSEDGGGTWVRATIIAPGGGTGGGSSIAANNLQTVDADGDGITPTTYTIIHDWTADGLSSIASVWWQLRCSKTQF